MNAIGNYVSGTLTKEQAVQTFKDELRKAHPDVIVE